MQPIHLARTLIAITACAWGLAAGSSGIALADDTPQTTTAPDHTERFKDMTPEQREAKRQQMREEWSKLTPEQKEQRRNEMHERMEKMTPEQREKIRQRMHERMEKMSPVQREEMKKEMQQHLDKMPPEEKENFLKERQERKEFRRNEADQQHDNASPQPVTK